MNKELKDIIKCDFYRYYENKKPVRMWRLRDNSLNNIIIYRKANYYSKRNKLLYLFYVFLLKIRAKKYAFNIPAETKIGKGFFIGHNGAVTINTNAVIGKNCNVATGVVIGRENRGSRKGCPVIGDRVWIGSNAVVVGKITIGNNVLIAPNSFVNFDVPENSIVIGNPAKIFPNRPDATDCYCHNLID